MKCIPIPSCQECPHRDHKGGFGTVAYVPVCRKANKELPHTVEVGPNKVTHRMFAKLAEGIPEWCPLPDTEDCI